MVGRLIGLPLSWRRQAGAIALVLAVIGFHGCIADHVAGLMADFSAASTMPQRVVVMYVREMEPSAPPAAAPVPPRPAPRVHAPRQAVVVAEPAAPAASAPVEEPPPEPETPLPVPEPAIAEEPPAAAEPPMLADAPVPAAPAASAPSFEWPGSTRLSYVLTGNFQGEIHGTAQVEWVRIGMRYQVHLDVTVGVPFAPLLTRRMTSEGQLTPEGLSPERFDQDTKRAFRDRQRLSMHFEPDAVVLANGQRSPRWPGLQDAASQFVQLSYLFTTQPELLKTGGTIAMPLALPRYVDHWVYDVLEQETLYTPFGAIDTFHLKPRRVARGRGDLSAEIWFAPSLHYLPARIRIEQDAQTYVDLMISRRPQLAAP